MDFAEEITRAAGLFESGKHAEAAHIFKGLCEKEDLDPSGRMIAAINLAVTYDRMGHPDHAVGTYEYAVGVVTKQYVFAQEQRADYLFKQGRLDDAIAVWEHLAALEFIDADRATAVRHNLEVANAQRGA